MFRFDNYQQLHKHKLENVQQLLTRKMCILAIKMYNSSMIRVHPESRKPHSHVGKQLNENHSLRSSSHLHVEESEDAWCGDKGLWQRSALHNGVSEASFIGQDKFTQHSQLNGDTISPDVPDWASLCSLDSWSALHIWMTLCRTA